jgi:hypothetical protein
VRDAKKNQAVVIKSRDGLPASRITVKAIYGWDHGEWWCEPDARPRYSVPNPQTRLSLADQLRWLVKAGVEDDAKERLGRAFRRKQIGYEPQFAVLYDRARINWATGEVVLPRPRRQKFVPALSAAEFLSQIRLGQALSRPDDPDEFDELWTVHSDHQEEAPIDDSAAKAVTEQRPAAYRFRLRDGKIDVLP